MKIGIISDIHGNINALEAVLKEFEIYKIDKIICLGDLVGGAPKSEKVVKKIMQIKDKCSCVRGNRENYIINGMPLVVHDEKIQTNQDQIDANQWVKSYLSDISLEYIYNLPKEIIWKVENSIIYIAHYPMNKDGSFRKHVKIATPNENEEMFSGINADIYLYGHTHERVNPGALGCPGKTNDAPYGILDITKDAVVYTEHSAKYNAQEVIQDIETTAFPGYKSVLKFFYGKVE